MTTGSMVVVVLALACALVAVLVWGFRRVGDGPVVTAVHPDAETRQDSESR
jgi:hypothetical protein